MSRLNAVLPTQQAAQPTLADLLDQVARHVRFALNEVTADSKPSWETLDDVARDLVAALRDLEAVQNTFPKQLSH